MPGAPLQCFESGGSLASAQLAGADFKEFRTPITRDRFEVEDQIVSGNISTLL